jgi:hypothetical protein
MPRHPVHTLLAEAAYAGRELEKKELAELQLSTADTAHVKRPAREAAFMYDGGERGKAREHARQRSQEIIASLPAEAQDPRYLHEPEQLDHLGPRRARPARDRPAPPPPTASSRPRPRPASGTGTTPPGA